MKLPASGRQTARLNARRNTTVVIACLLLLLGLAAAGCGGGSSTDTTATTVAANTVAANTTATTGAATDTTSAAPQTPAELGKAIGATWTEAMQTLVGLLDDQPEPADVKDEIANLKEGYVQKLVAFGEQKEALDTAGKAEVDSAVTSALSAAADTEWYANYMDIYDAYSYMSGDVDFTNLIAGFNILTQYADFDLLKKQAPDEAARLGIE